MSPGVLLVVRTSNARQAAWACAAGGLAAAAGERLLVPASTDSIASRLERAAAFLGARCELRPWAQARGAVVDALGGLHPRGREAEPNAADGSDALLAYRDACTAMDPELVSDLDRSDSALEDRFAGRATALAWSSDGLVAAMRTALLDGRRVLYAPDASAAAFRALRGARSVLAAPPRSFRPDDLRNLLRQRRDAGSEAPLGLLYPFGEGTRELAGLKAHLYARLAPRDALPFTFSYPLERRHELHVVGRARFVLGLGDNRVPTLDLLREPSQFFFSTPHSNGVNLSLGSVVLCSREDDDGGRVPERALPCFYADVCNRDGPNRTRVGASELRTVVAFLNTCWGVLLRGAAYDSEISLGHRMMGSPYVAALVTAHTSSLLDRASGPFLAEEYARGVPLGEAVASLNRRHFERYGREREAMILFGDPEASLTPAHPLRLLENPEFDAIARSIALNVYSGDGSEAVAERPPVAPIVSVPVREFAAVPVREFAAVADREFAAVADREFAAIEYTRAVVVGTRAARVDALQESLDGLARATDRLWSADAVFESRRAHGPRTRFRSETIRHRVRAIASYQSAWIAFFTRLVCTLGGYVRFQVDRYFEPGQAIEPTSPCPYCGSVVDAFRQRLVGSRAVSRLRLDCPNCATIYESVGAPQRGALRGPEEWRAGTAPEMGLELEVDEGGCGGAFSAALVLEPFKKPAAAPVALSTTTGSFPPPAGQWTVTLPAFELSEDRTIGSHYLNGVVILDAGVAFLRRAVCIRH